MQRQSPLWLAVAGIGAGLLAFGLLAGQPTVVAWAVPAVLLAFAGARATPQRPGIAPTLASDDTPGRVVVALKGTDEVTAVGTSAGPGLVLLRGRATGEPASLHLVADESVPGSRFSFHSPASGEAEVGRVSASGLSDDLLREAPDGVEHPISAFVLPRDVAVARALAPTPKRLARNPGSHRSRLAGPGTDPKDLRLFTPSDALRDVDWRATARRPREDELMVRERYAENQGTVRVVLDVGADLTWNPHDWFRPQRRRPEERSVFTEERLAALAVARTHLTTGDRVGLSDVSGLRTPVRAATGMRQLDRLRAHLAHVRPLRTSMIPRTIAAPEQGALVYVVSSFVEPTAADRVLRWTRHGFRVVAIDVGRRLDGLSRDRLRVQGGRHGRNAGLLLRLLHPDWMSPGEANTVRVMLAARRAHLADLRHAQVPVLTWTDAAALAADLALLEATWRRSRR